MDKYIVGFCSRCCCKTKHKLIDCTDNVAWKIFENVVTLGLAAGLGYDYNCECTVCNKINVIHK